MKSFIVFALIVAVAVAAPAGPDADAVIVKQETDNIGTGDYTASHETSNGIKSESQGTLENVGTENEATSVQGRTSYTGPDGVVYTITYIADALGYRPQGAHLPVGPQA